MISAIYDHFSKLIKIVYGRGSKIYHVSTLSIKYYQENQLKLRCLSLDVAAADYPISLSCNFYANGCVQA